MISLFRKIEFKMVCIFKIYKQNKFYALIFHTNSEETDFFLTGASFSAISKRRKQNTVSFYDQSQYLTCTEEFEN